MALQEASVGDIGSCIGGKHQTDEILGGDNASLREPSAAHDAGSMTSMPPAFRERANGGQPAPEGHVRAPGLATLTSNCGRRVLRAKRTMPKPPEEIDVEVAKLSGESFKIKVKPTCTVGDAKKAVAMALGLAGEEKRIATDDYDGRCLLGSAYTREFFRKLYEKDQGHEADVYWENSMLSDERHYAFGLADSCQLVNSSSLSEGMPLFMGRLPATSIVGPDMVRLTLVFSSFEQ